jgi:hypothetical protein
MQAFVEAHRPDELLLTANIFDHAARVRSFAMAMQAFSPASARLPTEFPGHP